jgi:hypothetical protein
MGHIPEICALFTLYLVDLELIGGMVNHNGARLEVWSPNENVLNQKFPDHRHKYCAGCIAAFGRRE